MNRNTETAKKMLVQGGYTLVLSDGVRSVTSYDRGVKPLLLLLESGEDYSSFSSADKVVGAAAAYLYVLLGVNEVYAFTISEKAGAVLEKYGIAYEYGLSVQNIINRSGDGICPMEEAVEGADGPEDALVRIRNKLSRLQKSSV